LAKPPHAPMARLSKQFQLKNAIESQVLSCDSAANREMPDGIGEYAHPTKVCFQ
jgi:hypothetical protein